MTAARKHEEVFLAAGGLVAAFAGYEFLLKPWLDKRAAAGLPTFPTPFVPSPTGVGPTPGVPNGGVQGSIVDARISPGGDVGQAMWRKGWTQQVAKARLDALKAAFATATQAIVQLRAQTTRGVGASDIAAAQLAAQQNDAAAAVAIQRQQQDLAAGDTIGANQWATAAAGHQADAREIRQRISTATSPPDNSAAIAAYQGAIAGYQADYNALTGLTLA